MGRGIYLHISRGHTDGDDIPVDDFPEYYSDETLPPCNAKFNALDQINAAASSILDHCFDKYIAEVEVQNLRNSLREYNDIVDNGYDGYFADYIRFTEEFAQPSLNKYMSGAQASGNFKCEEEKPVTCCSDCSKCSFCTICSSDPGCKKGQKQRVPIDCPTGIPDGSTTGTPEPEITYTLTNPDAFFKQIQDQYGIPKDWVIFDDYMAALALGCSGTTNPKCSKTAPRTGTTSTRWIPTR